MRFEIPIKLPSLNEYVNECRRNKYNANNYKAKYEQEIGLYLMKMPKWNNPIKINFIWIEGDKRRDLDNVAFAKKFILDAMVKFGKLKDDNRKYVTAFTDTFVYGEKTKVILDIVEVSNE